MVLLIVLIAVSGAAFSQESVIKKRQDDWTRCLKSSFAIQKTETRDKNLAAERSFQACASEEDALRTEAPVPADSFAHLKAETKKVLMEGK